MRRTQRKDGKKNSAPSVSDMEVFHPHDALKPLRTEVSDLHQASLHSTKVEKVSGRLLQENVSSISKYVALSGVVLVIDNDVVKKVNIFKFQHKIFFKRKSYYIWKKPSTIFAVSNCYHIELDSIARMILSE